ncbi:hypothetical protein ACFC06_18895 [Nocardia sp. NPDC056064]|uniref:hypothetical protein n=1 Tax=Nocardia sp. NPDC056064 TaxID=3345701 RepID=UPI0035DD4164
MTSRWGVLILAAMRDGPLTPTGPEVAAQLHGLLAWVEARAEEIVRFGGGGDGGI